MSTVTQTPRLLSIRKASAIFGVSRFTIKKWIALGLPLTVIDGQQLLRTEAIEEWIRKNEVKQSQEN